jgi:hypothetical protein
MMLATPKLEPLKSKRGGVHNVFAALVRVDKGKGNEKENRVGISWLNLVTRVLSSSQLQSDGRPKGIVVGLSAKYST